MAATCAQAKQSTQQVQIFSLKREMKRKPSNPDGFRNKMEAFFIGEEKSGGKSRLFNSLGTSACEFRLLHGSSTVEGGMLSSLLFVPTSLTAGYCLTSAVFFRACWVEDEAEARQGMLPDSLFVSGEEQGLAAAAIAMLPNSLALQGTPGRGS